MNPARPTSGGFERPTLVLYFADTQVPLSHSERKALEDGAIIVSVTTRELLLKLDGRMVVVRQAGDPHAPAVPAPKVFP